MTNEQERKLDDMLKALDADIARLRREIEVGPCESQPNGDTAPIVRQARDIAVGAELALVEAVRIARNCGATWESIAPLLGVGTKQAAAQWMARREVTR